MNAVVSGADGIVFFPIRHHSPACALALSRALDELRPRQVLVEAPSDFEPLLSQLIDPRARPPLALVSLPAEGDETGPAIYPFCAHSPEYVALGWADRAGARSALIDLPARHPAMQRRYGDDPGPAPLIEDWRLDHNAYVAELCARRGVANGAALWDALFEAQGAGEDWRGFFAAVGVYCAHIRAVTPDEEMQADGTLEREAEMAAQLGRAAEASGPIAVVTGGFHTPALQDALAGGQAAAFAKPVAHKAYLIRYGFRQLDRASGYGAGLPHPAWYDRLWRALPDPDALDGLASDVLADFADHLRRTAPQLAMATPTLTAAALAARRLAALRGLPWPGRTEVFDAVRSSAVKDAIEIGRTPLLNALDAFLTGDAIGELPPGAAQPPIVEGVRSRARALGFTLDTGETRTRDLDILRKPRHAEASALLHALDFVDAQFAKRIRGPDPVSGWRGDALFETWSYAWSPMVEQRLIGRAADGETLEALCAAELVRRREQLAAQGQARSAAALAALLAAVAPVADVELTRRALAWCGEAVAEDAEAGSVIRALSLTAALAASAGPDLAADYAGLRRKGFERLLLLFPHLADTPPDRLGELVRSLADLAALAADDDAAIDREALSEAVGAALGGAMPPLLNGALTAFSGLIGLLNEDDAARRIATALDGTYVQVGDRVAALTGCLTVSPRLIVHSEPLLDAVDRFLDGVDADTFLQMLPQLRLGLGELSPSEIDRVAEWVAGRYRLQARELTRAAAPEAEAAENLVLSEALEATWRSDGLGDWLEVRA